MMSAKTIPVRQKIIYGLLFLVPIGLACVMSFVLGYRVLINTTHSLPHTFYVINPAKGEIQRGDYIAFTHAASAYVVVKQVMGIEGDRIHKNTSGVSLSGSESTLDVKEMRSDGSALTRIHADVVPEKTVFVAGSHPDSFDSRYQEFGLVPLQQVRGRVWPLF